VVIGERITARGIHRVLKRRTAAAGLDSATVSVGGLRTGAYTTPSQSSLRKRIRRSKP
jgi:hypothetical protein